MVSCLCLLFLIVGCFGVGLFYFGSGFVLIVLLVVVYIDFDLVLDCWAGLLF